MIYGGRYEALKALGHGGAGEAVLVRHTNTDKVRVLKLLREEYRDNGYLRNRLLSEGLALQELRHPHIVTLVDVFEDDHAGVCIVLEYCPGGDAYKRAKQQHGLPWKQATGIIRDALKGLAHAHEHEIIHRDIKPGNILFGPEDPAGNEVVKLADFGIARLADEEAMQLTKTGMRLGSPSYMAPEQRIDPRDAGVQADLFSMGASLYMLVAGHTPPDLAVGALVPGHQVWGAVPLPLRSVLLNACQYDPARRYQTADEMREHLEGLAGAGPTA